MTNHDKRLEFIVDIQQEIINAQRFYIQELEKKIDLPTSDGDRRRYYIEQALMNLEVIHKEKKIVNRLTPTKVG
ncbi:MAG: hypothetical protein AAGB31_15875 [Bdellovibrio sp.]